jgi:hypothetical protein
MERRIRGQSDIRTKEQDNCIGNDQKSPDPMRLQYFVEILAVSVMNIIGNNLRILIVLTPVT